MALRPLFHIPQAQYVQVFPLKPAPFCKLFAGLSSTNKSAVFVLLSDSRSVLATLSSLTQSLWQIWQELSFPPVLSDCNGSPDTHFSRGTTRLMSWPDGERYSCLLQFLVVSLLLSLVSTLVFSLIGVVLSHLNFLTHRFPRFSLRNDYFLVLLQRTQPTVKLLSLGLAESRILPAPPAYTRPRTRLISFCTVQLRTLCVQLALWRLSVSLRPLVQALESCPDLGIPWSSAMPHPS